MRQGDCAADHPDPGTADSGIVPPAGVCEAAAVNHVTTTLEGMRCDDDGLPACC